jgi:hypothetical protein
MLLVQGEALSFDSLRCERSEQQLPPGCASDASNSEACIAGYTLLQLME